MTEAQREHTAVGEQQEEGSSREEEEVPVFTTSTADLDDDSEKDDQHDVDNNNSGSSDCSTSGDVEEKHAHNGSSSSSSSSDCGGGGGGGEGPEQGGTSRLWWRGLWWRTMPTFMRQRRHREQLKRAVVAVVLLAVLNLMLIVALYTVAAPVPVPGREWFLSPVRNAWKDAVHTGLSVVLCNALQCATPEEYAIDLRPAIIWPLLLAQGYAYVATVTERRSSPIGSRRRPLSVANFVSLCLTPRWFCLYCRESQPPSYSRSPQWFVWFPTFLVGPMLTLSSTQQHSVWGLLLYVLNNHVGLVLGFLTGLQFTYLDKIETFRFFDHLVNSTMWHKLTRRSVAALILTVIPIALIVLFNVVILAIESWVYLVAMVAVVGVLNGVLVVLPFAASGVRFLVLRARCRTEFALTGTVQGRRPLKLHVHHYYLLGLCLPFFRLHAWRNPLSLWSLGVAAGIYVEGVSRWGMDPVLSIR